MAGISKINSTKAQQALASLINNDAEMEIKTEHITLSTISSPTYEDLESFINNYMSAGKFTGGGFTDNGDGSITVAAGTGMIKSTDSDTGTLYSFDWAEDTNVTLTDNSVNFIYVDYNSGTPQIGVATSSPIDHNTKVLLGLVYRSGTTLHMTNAGQLIANYPAKTCWKDMEVNGKFQWVSGVKPSETGTRYLVLSEGTIYAGLTKKSIPAYDSTSTAMTTYYGDGGTGWNTASLQQIDNQYYDNGSGSLASMTSNYRTCRYFYIDPDGHAYMVYGTAQYNKLADAIEEVAPDSLPDLLSHIGMLVAKIIIKEGDTNFERVYSYLGQKAPAGTVADHQELGGILGSSEGYHLSENDYTELSEWLDDVTLGDGGDITTPGSVSVHDFTILSTDSSDNIAITHDNENAYFKITDGQFKFQTDEGTNTPTYIDIQGKGTGSSNIKCTYAGNDSNVTLSMSSVSAVLTTGGSTIRDLDIQNSANANITMFKSASEGETPELKIYGYGTGDALRSLEIGVGVDAADTASFDGLSNYKFDGNVDVVGELTAGTKTFLIDHPLQPLSKNLVHMAIEGPRVDLIYRGTAMLKDGKATVNLDTDSTVHPMLAGTFDALTQNPICTSLQNQTGFNRLKPSQITNGKFTIECEDPTATDVVAWVVMAERRDPFIKSCSTTDENGRLIPEHDKETPAADALADKTEIVTDAKDVGETTVKADVAGKAGYPRHYKAYGVELPTRKIIKTLKAAAEKEAMK